MIRRFVILGASGDLTSRYLLPALAQLRAEGRLPGDLEVLGISRDDWDDDAFRRHAAKRAGPGDHVDALLPALRYRPADVTRPGELRRALGKIGKPLVAYLALPPGVFAPALEALGEAEVPEGSRVVVEKPFGQGHSSALELNALLHRTFAEGSVFRVDHFLHKQTIQNVLGLRFANRVFEPVWKALHVERVEIVWDETIALEGRGGYYDRAGALRDMVQNHLLQLLCLVAMEPPATLGERDLRDRKVEVLRAIKRPTPREVKARTARGRYTAGRAAGSDVPDYTSEEGVDPGRGTETFALVSLEVGNWRWAGVPFILRTGKALEKERRHIAVRFRDVPHLAFGEIERPVPNVLRLELDPDRLALGVNLNGPGDPFDLERADLDAELAPQEVPAYARLLLDVLEGDPTLSIRDDEAEEAWRIVEPILEAWGRGASPLVEYPAGSEPPLPPHLLS